MRKKQRPTIESSRSKLLKKMDIKNEKYMASLPGAKRKEADKSRKIEEQGHF